MNLVRVERHGANQYSFSPAINPAIYPDVYRA
jgi:hypothetical protein